MTEKQVLFKVGKSVAKIIKHYQTDFTEYDLNNIQKMKRGEQRVLIVNEYGTFFPKLNGDNLDRHELISQFTYAMYDKTARAILIEKLPRSYRAGKPLKLVQENLGKIIRSERI